MILSLLVSNLETASPVTASIRRTPEDRAVSLIILKAPISPVRET